MYHYYDEMTEPNNIEIIRNATIDETIKRLDELANVNNYEKLVGGAYYNPNLLHFLPFEGNARNKKSRSYRVVNIKPLKEVIARCNSDNNNISDIELQLVEFFALTLSRRLKEKSKDSLALFYRLDSEVYYRTNFQKSSKAIFDLGSFFVSITNIQGAYNRLHPDLYNLAFNRSNSLFCKLRNMTNEHYCLGTDYDNNKFLSWCVIRNAVILQELGNSFSYVRTGRTQSSDQIELLRDFFSQVAEFNIKTYDKTKEGTAYNIKFDYARVCVNLFNDLKEDENAKRLFQQVFYDTDIVADSKPFDIQIIIRGLQHEVLKVTLKRRILEKTSITSDYADFWNQFDELASSRKFSKAQAESILQILKESFNL